MRGELQLLLSCSGIYSFYLYYGVLQERIFKPDATDGSRFTQTLSLLLVQCFFNLVLGALGAALLGPGFAEERRRVSAVAESSPFARFGVKHSGTAWVALFSLSYLTAMTCSNSALQYVSYPFQALAKSCKMVPVMLANVSLGGVRYSALEFAVVLMITGGVVGFSLAKQAAAGSIVGDSSAFGMGLLFASLCLDGVTSSSQKLFSEEFRPSSYFLMAAMNLFSCLYVAPAAALTGEAAAALAYVQEHPALLYDIVAFSMCSAFGQLFIFYSVVNLGPLATTTITTTRKFFTVLVSVFLFPENELNARQWAAVLLVFSGLAIELAHKAGKSRAKTVAKAEKPKTS